MSTKTSSLSYSIVGLPNVGKSSLFNVLTMTQSAESANFPFCTIEPNVGIAKVEDTRLNVLAQISNSKEIVNSIVKIVDVAGLVKGASEGAGLGNKFLSHVRETDGIIQVLRCFPDENITHVMGNVDPLNDADTINTELILADLFTVENAIKALKKAPEEKVKALKKASEYLSNGTTLINADLEKSDLEILSQYNFLTLKPMIYVANFSEKQFNSNLDETINELNKSLKTEVVPVCVELEEMLLDVPYEEKITMFKKLDKFGREFLVKKAFSTLGLISYFTTGPIETRAWTIKKGSLAPQAAGRIHTDIERGFIKAEVIRYDDYVLCNGRQLAKEKGCAMICGKDYEVQEGDVILFFHKS